MISFTRSALYGGELKKTVQGAGPNRRERLQHFDKSGHLRREEVLTTSPTGQEKEQYLIREYAYDSVGNLTALTEPSGKRVAYRYNDLGQLIQRDVFTGSTLVRSALFEYDRFGRLAAEITPKQQGQGYNYPEVRTTSQVTQTHKVMQGGVTYEVPATIEDAVSVGGRVTRQSVSLFDTWGRLTETRRTADGRTRLSTFNYGDGKPTAFALVRADGTVDETQVRRAVQPGDKVASQTVAGVRTEFTYDQAGHPVVEVLKGGLVVGHDQGVPQTRDRRLLRAFDGFGNKASESSFTGAADKPKLDAVKVWRYHGTGELQMSWEGNPDNVTAYRYGTGADAGRLVKETQGVGWDAERGEARTPRSGTVYTYDAFGRQDSQTTLGGVKTSVIFNAQDRPVQSLQADGSTVTTLYSATGVPEKITTTRAGVTTTVTREVDALGRITREQVTAGTLTADVRRTFDPQDRVLREQDSRLDMNRPGEDQATYYVYDARGNLIKQLGAAMSTNGAYFDDRRPYVEFTFDGLNRKVEARTLLAGVMTPSELTLDTNSNLLGKSVAVTRYGYDDLDRPTTVTTPNGTTITQTFDGAGNLTAQSLPSGEGDPFVTRFGYDGAGRVVQTINPAGESTRVTLNTLGQVTAQLNAVGQTIKVMTYTPDGLLTGVAQPKSGVLTAQAVGESARDLVWTEKYTYAAGQRTPVQQCEAWMDKGADAAGACTTIKYDAAGRPVHITAPDGTVTQQGFDAQGRLLEKTTPDGRTTRYAYDVWGRLAQEQVSPNAADRSAGLTAGQTKTFTRNLLGQVVTETVNGVATSRQFNSLGLLTAESRPALTGAREVPTVLRAYRLDGQLSAQTSASYQGALRGANARYEIDGQTTPAPTAGAVQVFQRTPAGQLVKESLVAASGGSAKTLMTATYTLNPQGLPIKRDFTGDPGLYRAPLGDEATYATGYRYDRAGRLVEQWDDVKGTKLNVLTLAYAPSGQVATAAHDVRIYQGGAVLAASEGRTRATYDTRGQLQATAVTAGGQTTETAYTYYAGGQVASARVSGGGSVHFMAYDPQGRVQALTVTGLQSKLSAQAAGKFSESATVRTSYSPDGVIKQTVERGDGNCVYARHLNLGLGGQTYGVQEWANTCTGTPSTTQTQTLNAQGLITGVTTTAGTASLKVTRSFSDLLQPTSELQTLTGQGSGQWNVTRTYTPDGTLQSQALQSGAANTRTEYQVDGLGRQTGLSGSAFDGWQQRFDADGRVTALIGPAGADGRAPMMAFRYDTAGELLLSAQVGPDGRATSLSVQGLPGQPQTIALKAGPTTRTRDVTYTMLEGLFGENWSEFAPQGTGGTVTALAAPTPLTSAQFGLVPKEVTAPGTLTEQNLTPLSLIAQTLSTPAVTVLSAPAALLPSEAFSLKPAEVRAPATGTGLRPDVTGGTTGGLTSTSGAAATNPFLRVTPPSGWQPQMQPDLKFQASPTSSLLEELRRLAQEQRGPFGGTK
ncbi:hypothetical protein [Deinococcus arcticus]|uniref:Uncharacterized protein n=1 Tax=Deinococcus arcticus TaxID=2136176 RepID=A0A2T3W3J2_9DEIO|nr:hypothetical protein [Deinococcus arcticus]PTA66399.1 hypothetical protein C8263_18170 [Deinococcus arcticus]